MSQIALTKDAVAVPANDAGTKSEITLDELQTKMAGDKELQDLSEELGGTV